MTYVAALIIFEIIYFVLFMIPAVAVGWLIQKFVPSLTVVGGVAILGAFFLAGYRAHLAASVYGERDMGLVEAHLASRAEFKASLAFVPLVGHWFGGERDT